MGLWDWINENMAFAGKGNRNQRKAGEVYSVVDMKEKEYAQFQLEEQRAYEQQLWEQRESVQGMAQQYKDAGFNPVLATGVQPGGGQVPTQAPVEAQGTQEPTGLEVVSQMMNMVSAASQIRNDNMRAETEAAVNKATVAEKASTIKRNDSEAKSLDASTENLGADTTIKQIQARYEEAKLRLQNDESRSRIDKAYSDIKVNESDILVNNKSIPLMSSQQSLNEANVRLTDLDAKKASLLLPYVQGREEAEIFYTNIRSYEASSSASEKDAAAVQHLQAADTSYKEAILKTLQANYQVLVNAEKQGLLSSGFVQSYIENMNAVTNELNTRSSLNTESAEYKKRMKSLETADMIVKDICNVVDTGLDVTGTFMTGGTSTIFREYTPGYDWTGKPTGKMVLSKETVTDKKPYKL